MVDNQNPSSSRRAPRLEYKLHVFLIFIIYNIYIIYLLIIFFNSFTSSSTNSGGSLTYFQSESTPHTSTKELLSYMSMLNENEDVDIMMWWKRNARGYPTLVMMARDVFAVLMSIVPSESCFSSVNRILFDKRSKFGEHIFERLGCLKDWIDAEERNQYRDQPQSFGV
jgi:hAT family C-terminal dimerisation region